MKIEDFKKKDEKEVLFLEDNGEIPVLKYRLLEEIPWIRHCFTTREGGVSDGIFSSLNLSFTRGDREEDVRENFSRVAKCMGSTVEQFVFTDQTHTRNVRRVTAEDGGAGITKERGYSDIDGLITDVPGLVLSTFYADCVPLYFVDTRNHAIGLSHSGWRGTVGRMGECTIKAMGEAFGTKAEDMICAIGPSICQDCYEVSEDVAEEFRAAFPGHEAEILQDKGSGKYLLDLWRANEIVLMQAGVQKERIATANICTCCNHRLLFSHRASHGKRGNLGAFLMLTGDREEHQK